ncbi:MAG: hypothetical protein H5T80_01300 [Dietzia sp.]|nr:hypothetical protein [Dietzia sp.]
MSGLPRDTRLDSTLALMRDGYRFGRRRYARLDSDTFRTRLMLRPAVVTHGAEAAQMFSVPGRFTRNGALPPTTLRLLQDLGSVATLDGEAHHARKRLFLPLLKAQAVSGITQAMLDEWRDRLPRWERMPRIVVHDELQDILCRAVCAWLGIPLTETEARARSTEMAATVVGAGSVGPRAVRGLRLRRRSETWAAEVIDRVRRGWAGPARSGPCPGSRGRRSPSRRTGCTPRCCSAVPTAAARCARTPARPDRQ